MKAVFAGVMFTSLYLAQVALSPHFTCAFASQLQKMPKMRTSIFGTNLGKADVKFTRYALMFQDLLVDSIDGDIFWGPFGACPFRASCLWCTSHFSSL